MRRAFDHISVGNIVRHRLRLLPICCFLPMLLAGCGGSTGQVSTAATATAVPSTSTAVVTYKGHSGPVVNVVWSPDGTRLASCGNDGTVQVWSAQSGQMAWKTTVAQYAFAVAWSPNGKLVAGAGSDGSVAILDAGSGKLLKTLADQPGAIEGIAWSPDSKLLVAGSQAGAAEVWDVTTGKPLTTYKGHTASVERLAWSPDGTRIATAGYDDTVQVWEARTGRQLVTYKGHTAPVWSVAWSPGGKSIVSGTGAAGSHGPVTENNSVQVWDATTGKTLLTLSGLSGQAYALAWSHDGTRIAAGGDDHLVHLWDATSGWETLRYQGHGDIVFGVNWSPDDSLIASASVDGTVQIWRPQMA